MREMAREAFQQLAKRAAERQFTGDRNDPTDQAHRRQISTCAAGTIRSNGSRAALLFLLLRFTGPMLRLGDQNRKMARGRNP
jgi:hypothetical protein